MTRFLVVCTILLTALLFQTLRNRPPVVVQLDGSSEEIMTSSDSEISPSIGTTDSDVEKRNEWSPQQRQLLKQHIDSWGVVDMTAAGITDNESANSSDELLRLEYWCQRELATFGKRGEPSGPILYLQLDEGNTLPYRSLTIGKGRALIELPDGPQVVLQPGSITATGLTASAEPAQNIRPGSLLDSIQLVEMVANSGRVEEPRWSSWFSSGGPETLARLLPEARASRLKKFIERSWRNTVTASPEPESTRTLKSMLDWIASVKKLLRSGFPADRREETLISFDEWETWLSRYGRDQISQRTQYLRLRRDLRVLKLDVVKSTGF